MIAALHRAAALFALGLLAAGCANFSAISPGDSAPTVEARVGPPGTVWKNADGSEAWEYPMGPTGVQTFMIDIGPDRAVRAVRQVLTEEYFAKVVAGMSREDVRRLLGRPKEVWYFPARDEEVWTWRYLEVNYRFFNVLFDRASGTVRTTLRLDEVFLPGGGRGKR
ncbi:MAG: outer membrane protein assembly factor BamE [Betaproteobacteria bacterium]|nr:MAG: outer membrane protein assembly factor BamE [Betaproteobacteria bacterium]